MPEELREIIRGAIEAHGAGRVARLLGLSVEATCRLAGGLPTQNGTRMVAAAHIGRLEALATGVDLVTK